MFFHKFAMIICLTAIMAYVIAMFTFGALMHCFGPENDNCTIRLMPIVKKIKVIYNKFKTKQEVKA